MISEDLEEELGAIDAIYPEYLKELGPNIYQVKIPNQESVSIQLSFPAEYPNEAPHLLQVTSSDKEIDTDYLEILFSDVLDSIYQEGEVCIFDFLSELDAVLYVEPDEEVSNSVHLEELSLESISHDREIDYTKYAKKKEEPKPKQSESQPDAQNNSVNPFDGWIQSEPVIDRGSTFIAFTREIHSLEEARKYLAILTSDRKISRAAHNMTTWRIKNADGTQIQDCDDDGETAAGGRLLHLITVSTCLILFPNIY